jgi:glyoxylase I family protein
VIQPLGVHHVSINTEDVEAAVAFYTETLGLTVREDRPDFGFQGAWLNAGDQQVHLIAAPPPPARGQHFAIRVADLEAVVDALRSRGVEVSDAMGVGSSLQAFLSDPSGNQVELHQVGGARPAAP